MLRIVGEHNPRIPHSDAAYKLEKYPRQGTVLAEYRDIRSRVRTISSPKLVVEAVNYDTGHILEKKPWRYRTLRSFQVANYAARALTASEFRKSARINSQTPLKCMPPSALSHSSSRHVANMSPICPIFQMTTRGNLQVFSSKTCF